MTNFNFSKPAPIKSNEKKVLWYEKIWAGISLIALFGDGLIPKNAKDNIPLKWRNIIILIFILILAYLLGSGIVWNAKWIIESTKRTSFSLGDRFYYFGILVMLFIALDYFNMDKKLIDFSSQKKIIASALKDLGKGIPSIKQIENTLNRNKFVILIFSIMNTLSLLWTIWGIIFYDRILFSSLIVLSLMFAIAVAPVKNIIYVKYIFLTEIIVNLLVIGIILINHFLIF